MMRTITLTDHPSNIAVFEAASMHDAVFKAAAAFRQDGIQGMVWHCTARPFDWNEEDKLIETYESSKPNSSVYGTTRYMVFDHISEDNTLTSFLNDERRENLLSLKLHFSDARLGIRHSYLGDGMGHIDLQGGSHVPNENLPFYGFRVRALCAPEKLGTVVNDEWQVAAGDYLIFTGANSLGKALLHAVPKFLIDADQRPRPLDIYDFTPV